MCYLVLGLVLFLGMHSIAIFAGSFRDRQVAGSEKRWKGIFSIVSAVGLALIVAGYAEARLTPYVLYVPPSWLRHVAMLLLLPVFVLLLATYFPGRIRTAAKHPQLAAVKLWAFAHLLINGTLADVVLFGSFLLWAVADRISLQRRRPRAVPVAAPTKFNDVLLVVIGLALYAVAVLWLHGWLFGISLFPAAE